MAKYNKKERQWVEQFEEMEVWLIDRGYTLDIAHDVDDCVYLLDKIVCIQGRSRPESRYYSLLHECGHILVSQGVKQWEKDMPMYAQGDDAEDGRKRKGEVYKVSLVGEEIEAWKRGRRLSKKMGHHIDDKKYDRVMAKWVYSYIKMVVEGGDIFEGEKGRTVIDFKAEEGTV
jgi:hypothetical protein